MNIKQAAEQSGVSSPNIRFYEKEGLMTPARNRGNAYRDYTAEDIRTLKLIRMLRMLDMPLPVIQRVLNGEQPLTEALRAQQTVLEQQAAQLAGSIRFCAELTQQAPQVDQLDVDDCLKRMQDPQEPGGFFSGWLRDYRTVAENEQKKRFLERIDNPAKNWKFSASDLAERAYFDDYQHLYEQVIDATAAKEAPWYALPADQKWYTRYLVSEIVVDALEHTSHNYPVLSTEAQQNLQDCRTRLEAENS